MAVNRLRVRLALGRLSFANLAGLFFGVGRRLLIYILFKAFRLMLDNGGCLAL